MEAYVSHKIKDKLDLSEENMPVKRKLKRVKENMPVT
jgi:hypothetical protein